MTENVISPFSTHIIQKESVTLTSEVSKELLNDNREMSNIVEDANKSSPLTESNHLDQKQNSFPSTLERNVDEKQPIELTSVKMDTSSISQIDNGGQIDWSRRFTKDPPDLTNLEKYYPNMPAHYQKSVIVNNISPNLTIHQLHTFFSFCGKIERIDLSNGNFIGYSVLNATDAFDDDSLLNESKVEIRYFTEHAANTACLLDQTQLLGSYIKILKKSERQIHPLSEIEFENFLNEYEFSFEEDVDNGENDQESKPLDTNSFMESIENHVKEIKQMTFTSYSNSQTEALDYSLYVGNLHGMVTESEFVTIMSICGPIVNYQLAGDPTHPTRFGFVQYMHKEDRELALKLMNGFKFLGYQLKVNGCNKPIAISHPNLSKDEMKFFGNSCERLQDKLKLFMRKQDEKKSPPRSRTLSPHHRHTQRRRSPGPQISSTYARSTYQGRQVNSGIPRPPLPPQSHHSESAYRRSNENYDTRVDSGRDDRYYRDSRDNRETRDRDLRVSRDSRDSRDSYGNGYHRRDNYDSRDSPPRTLPQNRSPPRRPGSPNRRGNTYDQQRRNTQGSYAGYSRGLPTKRHSGRNDTYNRDTKRRRQ